MLVTSFKKNKKLFFLKKITHPSTPHPPPFRWGVGTGTKNKKTKNKNKK
jgi:hypothetical protein